MFAETQAEQEQFDSGEGQIECLLYDDPKRNRALDAEWIGAAEAMVLEFLKKNDMGNPSLDVWDQWAACHDSTSISTGPEQKISVPVLACAIDMALEVGNMVSQMDTDRGDSRELASRIEAWAREFAASWTAGDDSDYLIDLQAFVEARLFEYLDGDEGVDC